MSGWRVCVHILNFRGSAALTYFTVVSQFSYPHHPRSACGLDFSLAASHDDPSWNRDEDTRRLLNKYGCCWENAVATLHQQKPDINLYVVFCAQGILLAVQWLLLYSVSRWPGHMATHVARQPQIDGWWEENSMENPQQPFRTRRHLKPWKPKETPAAGVPSIQIPTKMLLTFNYLFFQAFENNCMYDQIYIFILYSLGLQR